MQLTDIDIRKATHTVWTSFGLDAEEVPTAPKSDELSVVGCIQISGGWVGGVEVRCPISLARKAAAAMTMLEPDQVGDDELRDAFGEIVNMIGGNVKTMLGGALSLSLPVVVNGKEFTMSIRNTHAQSRVCFLSSGGLPLSVTLFAQDK